MQHAGTRLCLALLAILALPALAAPESRSMIVPNRAIGPFQLGMTPDQILATRRGAPCNVSAAFEKGKTARLETNCGGAYLTIDRITVGMGSSRILQIFGTPDRVTDSDFANTQAEWWHYTRYGIAFRVIYGSYSGFIQAVAVFPCVRCLKQPKPAPTPPGGPDIPPDVGDDVGD
jgi:hypothetical protein